VKIGVMTSKDCSSRGRVGRDGWVEGKNSEKSGRQKYVPSHNKMYGRRKLLGERVEPDEDKQKTRKTH